MARDFANTSGSPNIDYIVYSGVPPISGLGTVSIVMRCAGDSDTVSYGTMLSVVNAGVTNGIAIGRNATEANLYHAYRSGTTRLRTFPFTFDGTMRSVISTFDGSASPKDVAYVDGVSQTISETAFPNTTIGTPTVCEISGTTGVRFNGRLAEVALYNRVITQAEATMHAAGMSCLKFPRGLIFYAPLIREVHDIAGGLTGTITGTTVADHPRIYA